MPATRSSTASRAVKNSTHTCGISARSRRMTSRPLKSGSMMSSTTASGRNSRAVRTASAPLPAVSTFQPSYRSTLASSSARLGSSSTTSTRTGVPSGRWTSALRVPGDCASPAPLFSIFVKLAYLNRTCAQYAQAEMPSQVLMTYEPGQDQVRIGYGLALRAASAGVQDARQFRPGGRGSRAGLAQHLANRLEHGRCPGVGRERFDLDLAPFHRLAVALTEPDRGHQVVRDLHQGISRRAGQRNHGPFGI